MLKVLILSWILITFLLLGPSCATISLTFLKLLDFYHTIDVMTGCRLRSIYTLECRHVIVLSFYLLRTPAYKGPPTDSIVYNDGDQSRVS